MPKAEDGAAISKLIAACPPLDRNSAYCNLLQCSHFADTCIVAERDGYIAGWISGYRPPSEPDRFFIWQVAVSETARGAGLAGRMIDMLLARPSAAGARALITTITRSEEHTSELQSLMRISYAVFCLKKKNTKYTYRHTITQ